MFIKINFKGEEIEARVHLKLTQHCQSATLQYILYRERDKGVASRKLLLNRRGRDVLGPG